MLLIVAVVGSSTPGTQILAYGYAGQYYPTASRSTGAGMASGIGRIGAMLVPIEIRFLVPLSPPLAQNLLAIARVGAAGAVAVALINHRRSASTHQAKASVERSPRELAARS